MSYGDLIRTYFERSVAIQWYWTVYVLVIGGIVAFSTFRVRREFLTTVLITLLFLGFAYKNETAIEAAAEEREAIRVAAKEYPAEGNQASEVTRTRDRLEPTMPAYDIPGARYFHIFCAVLTIAHVWSKEWLRDPSTAN